MPTTYDIRDVPARTDGSRFYHGKTPGGLPAHPAQNFATIYSNLVQEREREATPAAYPEVRCELYCVVHSKNGHELKRRGLVIGPKVNEARRPTRIVKLESTPGEILDSVMLGEGEGAEKATDQAVWRSLLAVAERHNLQARELRAVCDSVARCLVARAGLAPMRPDELPQEHLMAVPVELPRERVEEEAEMEAVV